MMLFIVSLASNPTFDEFVLRFGREYKSSAERELRSGIFHHNLDIIKRLNSLAEDPTSATFGVNAFADMSAAEFGATRLLKNQSLTRYIGSRSYVPSAAAAPARGAAPSAINWFMNATTRVRDQGQCGSCWAFSDVEQIESDWFLSGRSGWASPQELSVQQVVDCDDLGAYGCSGTYADGSSGYNFVAANGGLALESAYPYISGKSGTEGPCRSHVATAGGTIRNYTYVNQPCDLPWDDCDDQDEDAMVAYVGSTGPLAVCVNAHNGWQHYTGGVLSPRQCGGHDFGSMDHCVQLIGYAGYDATQGAKASGAAGAYWIVRNSWADDWGLGGIIHLAMGANTCGVANVPSHAVL